MGYRLKEALNFFFLGYKILVYGLLAIQDDLVLFKYRTVVFEIFNCMVS